MSRVLMLFTSVIALVALASPVAAHDTDGESRPAVRRASTWYLDDDLGGGAASDSFAYGRQTDLPLFGDWDGRGQETPGVWREATGTFYLRDSYAGGAADETVDLGRVGDVPIIGDWDGDDVDEVGVVRGNRWLLDTDQDGDVDLSFAYGREGDQQLVGDWDGDGIDTPGIRRDNSEWYLRNSNDGGVADIRFQYGHPSDDAIVGRWTQPDVDHPGIVRESRWHLRFSHTGGPADHVFTYGKPDDTPLLWRTEGPEITYTFTVGREGNPNGDLDRFAAIARRALNDDRGWSLHGSIEYVQVSSGGDFHLWLTDDDDVGEKASTCSDQYSCTVGDDIYINDDNWNNATETWDHRDLTDYRKYVINHEVGHWLGLDHYNDSDRCRDEDGDGEREAPVMMQQSIDLRGCATNVWPLPFERERVRNRHLD